MDSLIRFRNILILVGIFSLILIAFTGIPEGKKECTEQSDQFIPPDLVPIPRIPNNPSPQAGNAVVV